MNADMEKIKTRVRVTEDGCWEWTMSRYRDGYGRIGRDAAHRVVVRLTSGPIAAGLEVDHLCRNRACVNPQHLEVVTHQENDRRKAAAKTHCRHGHELTEENTYVWRDHTDGYVRRQCRACNVLRHRAYMQRKAARGAEVAP